MDRLDQLLPHRYLSSPEAQEAIQRRQARIATGGDALAGTNSKPEVHINMVTDDDGTPYYQRHLDRHWAQFKDARLSDFYRQGVVEVCSNAYLNGRGVYVIGPTGTGKTHCLVALFKDICNARPQTDIAIVPWLDMVDAIKADFSKDEHERREAHYFKHLDVLLIDDFGKGQRTPWVLEQMYAIIETRLRLKKLTYFTSNYPLAEVETWGQDGEAIASRIRGMCNVLPLLGDDRRASNG